MNRSHLSHRIRRVLNLTAPETRMPWASGAIMLCTVAIGLATLWPVQAHSATPRPIQASETPAQDATSTRKTVVKININGTSYVLHTLDLTPDTPVTVNGEEKRFGDLTGDEQNALRDAVKTAQETPNGTANTHTERKIVLKVGGKTFELNTFDLTPDTSLKVDGATVRFGDLSAEDQQTVRQGVEGARSDTEAGAATETHVTTNKSADGTTHIVKQVVRKQVCVFKVDADTIKIYGDLKPDAIVSINGVKSKFKSLPASRQNQIRDLWRRHGSMK